jgi:hypothetical protein
MMAKVRRRRTALARAVEALGALWAESADTVGGALRGTLGAAGQNRRLSAQPRLQETQA